MSSRVQSKSFHKEMGVGAQFRRYRHQSSNKYIKSELKNITIVCAREHSTRVRKAKWGQFVRWKQPLRGRLIWHAPSRVLFRDALLSRSHWPAGAHGHYPWKTRLGLSPDWRKWVHHRPSARARLSWRPRLGVGLHCCCGWIGAGVEAGRVRDSHGRFRRWVFGVSCGQVTSEIEWTNMPCE